MMQKQDMHQYPNYSLTTSMFFAEIVYKLVLKGEELYNAYHNRQR